MILNGSVFKFDNGSPRSEASKAVQSAWVCRIQSCHMNIMEGFPYFAAATISCIVVGVDKAILADYCTFYLLARVLFAMIYVGPTILHPFRTGTFLFTLA